MKKTTKKYIVSSIITFITGFCLVLVANIDSLSLTSLGDGALTGLLFVAIRAGFKAVAEWFLATFANPIK